ncbi:MAG TPA: hypothetical protein VMT32_18315 [Bryobacteraceae bacterium]|nr:hypothetical protein [Bryobacteraceae bacterium]
MTPAAPTAHWRKVCEENFSRLIQDLEHQVEAEVSSRVSAAMGPAARASAPGAIGESRRALAEELNQCVRRVRKAVGIQELFATLLDVTVPFCDQAALFSVHDKHIRAERMRRSAGLHPVEMAADTSSPPLEIPVSQAAAFAAAIETRDPVIAISAPGEVTGALVRLFGHKPDDRIYLLPLVANDTVVAILYAAGRVQAPPLELLSEVAGLQCQIFTLASARPAAPEAVPRTQSKPSGQMVTISGTAPAPALKPAADAQHQEWWALSRSEQQLHLAAQRFARVQVAEMRLSSAGVLRSARESRDIYGTLKSSIDAARAEYRAKHMTASSTMVDYLHLELVRSLANDDATRLGPNYPGPLL